MPIICIRACKKNGKPPQSLRLLPSLAEKENLMIVLLIVIASSLSLL